MATIFVYKMTALVNTVGNVNVVWLKNLNLVSFKIFYFECRAIGPIPLLTPD